MCTIAEQTSTVNTCPSDGDSAWRVELGACMGFLQKIQSVRQFLEADFFACDAKWTLFVAAAFSYQYEVRLNPFPPQCLSEQRGQDIDRLVSLIHDTPRLITLLELIRQRKYNEIDTDVLNLLHWVLVDKKDNRLRTANFNSALRKGMTKPTHAFEVCQPSMQSMLHQSVHVAVNLAFYSATLDVVYSIINNGFSPDEPIVLTPNLNPCLEQTPKNAAWGASVCGSLISCVILCEYIDNPEYVEHKQLKCKEGKVPYEAVRVSNPCAVRPRFLLFYGSYFGDDENDDDCPGNWFYRHALALSFVGCFMAIAAVGVVKRVSVSRKCADLLTACKRILFKN